MTTDFEAGEFDGFFPAEKGPAGKGGGEEIGVVAFDGGDVEGFAGAVELEDFRGDGFGFHGGGSHGAKLPFFREGDKFRLAERAAGNRGRAPSGEGGERGGGWGV